MSEKLRWSEAEAIVRAYRAEHGAADIDVATLARALGTDESEIRRLAGKTRRFVDRSGVLSASIALGVLLVGALAFGPSLVADGPIVAALAPAPPQTFFLPPAAEMPVVDFEAYGNGGGHGPIRLRILKEAPL